MSTPTETVYLNPTTDEVWLWMRAGKCPWCGQGCSGDQCRARKCHCCTSVWLSDTPADVSDGHKLTVEDCPECKVWMATMHLENAAPAFAPVVDWMGVAA